MINQSLVARRNAKKQAVFAPANSFNIQLVTNLDAVHRTEPFWEHNLPLSGNGHFHFLHAEEVIKFRGRLHK